MTNKEQQRLADNGLNVCDKCGREDNSNDLIWIDSEDFTPKVGKVLKRSAILECYSALCEPCYKSELY